MNKETNDRGSLLSFISSMLIFGTIGIIRRYIPMSSALIAFIRGITGAFFLLSYMKLKKKAPEGGLTRGQLISLALTGFLISLNWILLFEAYNYTTVAIATLCYYMQPTTVLLLSPLVLHEKLTGKKLFCAFTAMLGMVFVSGVGEILLRYFRGGPALLPPEGIMSGSPLSGGSFRGILLGLGAALLYSAVVILNKKVRVNDPYRKTSSQLFFAGVCLIPYLLLTGSFKTGRLEAKAIILLLIVGIVHTGIAYLLYFSSMDGLRMQTVAILSYIDPVSALLFSAFILKEPLGLSGMIGAAMIIGSAIISEL